MLEDDKDEDADADVPAIVPTRGRPRKKSKPVASKARVRFMQICKI
jgi:hypothetical protein